MVPQSHCNELDTLDLLFRHHSENHARIRIAVLLSNIHFYAICSATILHIAVFLNIFYLTAGSNMTSISLFLNEFLISEIFS